MQISKIEVSNLLFFLFTTAFIVAPYWSLGANVKEQTVLFIILLSLGRVWSIIAGTNITHSQKLQITPIQVLLPLLFIIVLNFNPLNNAISFLGDEFHHILKPYMLAKLTGATFFFILVLGTGLIIWNRKYTGKLLKWTALTASFATFLFMIFFWDESLRPVFHQYLIRYPFLPTLIYAIPASLGSLTNTMQSEIWYRIIPMICVLGLSIISTKQLLKSTNLNFLSGTLFTIVLLTTPIIYYYSSILYLETLVVFLFILILRDIKTIICLNPLNDSKLGWLALLCLGFIKETIIPILFGVLLTRWFFQWKERFKSTSVKNEIKIVISLLLPIVCYLFFRGSVRAFNLDLSGLLNVQIYEILFQSLWRQLGLLFPLSVIGIIYTLRVHLVEGIFILITSLGILGFYFLDNGGIFIGYSRFNLFLLPFVIWVCIRVVEKFITNRIMYFATPILLIANYSLSPLNSDGSRQTDWELCVDCKNMSVDMVYSYNELFSWIKEEHKVLPKTITVFKFREYYYPYDQFYAPKYNLSSKFETLPLEQFKNNLLANSPSEENFWIIHPDADFKVDVELISRKGLKMKKIQNKSLILYLITQ